MRSFLGFGFAIALAGFVSPSAQGATFFARLTGDQERPNPITTSATGIGRAVLNTAQNRLEIFLQLFGVDLDGNQTPGNSLDNVTSAHIHRAPAGTNGPVVFGFISPNSDTNGDLVIDPVAGTIFTAWDLNEGNNTTLAAELSNLFNDGLYFNIHTQANMGGEIRGQIIETPEPAAWAVWLGIGATALLAARRRKA